MTVHAHLESPGNFPRLDSFARTGAASLLIDCHWHQDYTRAVAFKNAQIVGIDSRAPARREREIRPIPKVKRKKLRVSEQGVAGDFSNRRVMMSNCLAA